MAPDVEEMVVRELREKCSSCLHRAGCVIRSGSEKVVIQCEVFEEREHAWPEGDASHEAKGLCSSCDKRHFCFLPKNAAGVWHCEGYE